MKKLRVCCLQREGWRRPSRRVADGKGAGAPRPASLAGRVCESRRAERGVTQSSAPHGARAGRPSPPARPASSLACNGGLGDDRTGEKQSSCQPGPRKERARGKIPPPCAVLIGMYCFTRGGCASEKLPCSFRVCRHGPFMLHIYPSITRTPQRARPDELGGVSTREVTFVQSPGTK